MKIINKTDSVISVTGNGVGVSINPGASDDYSRSIFDTVTIKSDSGECEVICEYDSIKMNSSCGLKVSSVLHTPEEIVIDYSAEKAIILLSGGVDSTTLLGLAVSRLGAENVIALSAKYGQKHSKEMDCAESVAKYYGVRHEYLDLTEVFKFSNCSLLQTSTEEVPIGTYAEQQEASGNEKVSTFVPYRNGVLLACVAAFAQSVFPDNEVDVYIGIHADDAAGNAYADCSVAFADAMREAIRIGTYGKVHLIAPIVNKNKSEVVKLGLDLKVPYHLTTSCYNGRDKACGKCGTCTDRLYAFGANGVIDPIEYENPIQWPGCKKIDYLKDKYNA